MTVREHSKATALLIGTWILVIACSPGAADISITVDLQTGQSWVARGRPVDEGRFCDEGSRRVIEYRELDGDPLMAEVGRARVAQAAKDGVAAEIELVTEMACDDGSGVITIIEMPAAGVWSIEHGRGAFADISGSGSLVTTYAVTATNGPNDQQPDRVPLMLTLEGTIARARSR